MDNAVPPPSAFVLTASDRSAAGERPDSSGAQVEARLDQAARQFRDGEMLGFDTVTSYTARDTAYLVETEHFRARLDTAATTEEFALRVTSIFRREEGYWKLVHRHADPAARRVPGGACCRQGARGGNAGWRRRQDADLAHAAFPAPGLPRGRRRR